MSTRLDPPPDAVNAYSLNPVARMKVAEIRAQGGVAYAQYRGIGNSWAVRGIIGEVYGTKEYAETVDRLRQVGYSLVVAGLNETLRCLKCGCPAERRGAFLFCLRCQELPQNCVCDGVSR